METRPPTIERPDSLKNELDGMLTREEGENARAAALAMIEFERLTSEAETKEQKSALRNIREKIARSIQRLIWYSRNTAILGAVALAVDYYVTHPELEETRNEQGETEYQHPDKETQRILEVLAGKRSISEKEAFENFRALAKEELSQMKVSLPDDYDNYDLDELDLFISQVLSEQGKQYARGAIKNNFYNNYYFEKVDFPKEEARELYELLWKLERECGNPNIRFQTEGFKIFGIAAKSSDITRPHYDPLKNTVYVTMGSFISSKQKSLTDLFAELAHAKQLKENPVGFYWEAVRSYARIFMTGGFNLEELQQAQQAEYKIRGSFEQRTHSVTEQKLRKQYDELLTAIRGVKGKRGAP